MYCKKCGTKLEDDAFFCYSCGEQSISALPDIDISNNNIEKGDLEAQKDERNENWILVISALIVLVFLKGWQLFEMDTRFIFSEDGLKAILYVFLKIIIVSIPVRIVFSLFSD